MMQANAIDTAPAVAAATAARVVQATEPATARALWPTFLRRTLAEDSLRTPAEHAARG